MPVMIARERIHPNDYNVNAFDPANYPKLVESIREKGILEPLKVMPDPEQADHFILVDGYHRWRAAGDLGIEECPVRFGTSRRRRRRFAVCS
ncbi:MAG: ParB/RepB/Spo0J family partition protein [Armatimonadota bacterium]